MARIEDKTSEVIPYLQGRLIGFRVERGLTTFSDHADSVFGVKTGYKDKA